MSRKLYVGNIPFQAEEEDLKKFFSTIGEVVSVKIIVDLQTGHSRGFGFVEMASEEEAKKAIAELSGTAFMEKNVVVNEAIPQRARERKSFGGDRGSFDRGRGGFGRNKGSVHRKGRR
jgi:RNA recognition motif-containing protein